MQEILHKINNFTPTETNLFYGKTCAIIGNSSTILNSKYGKEIDANDFVIRFNQARVMGYESFVGSKTNLRIINTHSFAAYNGDAISYEKNAKVFSKFSRNIFSELNEKNYLATNNSNIEKAKNDFPEYNFNKITNETNDFIENLISGHSTAGFIGIILSLRYFENITIYGFNFYEGLDDHYYEKSTKYDRSEVHKMNNEKNIVNILESNNFINFKK
jgi:hypothetical protein